MRCSEGFRAVEFTVRPLQASSSTGGGTGPGGGVGGGAVPGGRARGSSGEGEVKKKLRGMTTWADTPSSYGKGKPTIRPTIHRQCSPTFWTSLQAAYQTRGEYSFSVSYEMHIFVRSVESVFV